MICIFLKTLSQFSRDLLGMAEMYMTCLWALRGGNWRQGKPIARWASENRLEGYQKRQAIAWRNQEFLEGYDFEAYLDMD